MAMFVPEVDKNEPNRRARGRHNSSVDEVVIDVLLLHGTQTLDDIGKLLPEVNWPQLFLAIDRLSRSGKISLWSPGFGEYLITAKPELRPSV